MKRLLAFLFCLFCFLPMFSLQEKNLFLCQDINLMCIISKEENTNFDKVITSGSQNYYYFSSDFLDNFKRFSSVDGIVLYFPPDKFDEIISFYNISYIDGQMEDEIFYGYSPLYKTSYRYQNKRINCQIAVQDEQIIVGFPAILTGF